MAKNQNKSMKKLPIQPMKTQGKIKKVKASKIKPGVIPEKSIKISKAVVAYLDILGFSEKKDGKDIEDSVLDFSGPLVIAAHNYPKVSFNVFSDCAFISTSIENAADLLSAIRFAFTRWVLDGIPVRGGISIGTYRETYSVALDIASRNFSGSLFSGTAVTEAVKLEGSGCGALLFTNEKCAEFYNEEYGEPIFKLKGHKIIGWSDDDHYLYWFVGVSFLRLLKLLSLKDGEGNPVAEKLMSNIRYSFTITDGHILQFLIIAILSLPDINQKARKKAIKIFKIKDPDDFVRFEELINKWLTYKDRIMLLRGLADADSSIPNQL